MNSLTKYVIVIIFCIPTVAQTNELELISSVKQFVAGQSNLEEVLSHYNSGVDSQLLEITNHSILLTLAKRQQIEIKDAISKILERIASGKNRGNGTDSQLFELVYSLEQILFFPDKPKQGKDARYSQSESQAFINYIINKYHIAAKKESFVTYDCFATIIQYANKDNGPQIDIKRVFVGLTPKTNDYAVQTANQVTGRYGYAIGKYRVPSRAFDASDIVKLDKLHNAHYCYGSNMLKNLLPDSEIVDWYVTRYSKPNPIGWQKKSDAWMLLYYTLVYAEHIDTAQVNKVLYALEKEGDYQKVTFMYQSLAPEKVFNYLLTKIKQGKFTAPAIKYLSTNKSVTKNEFDALVALWAQNSPVGKESLLPVITSNQRHITAETLEHLYEHHPELSRDDLNRIAPLFAKDSQRHGKLMGLIESNSDANLTRVFESGDSFVFDMLKYHRASRYRMDNYLSQRNLLVMFTDKSLVSALPEKADNQPVLLKQLFLLGFEEFFQKPQAYQYEVHLLDWLLDEMGKFEKILKNDQASYATVKVYYNGRLRTPIRRTLDELCQYRRANPDRVIQYQLKAYPEFYLGFGHNRRIVNKLIQTGKLSPLLRKTKSILALLDKNYINQAFDDCVNKDVTLPPDDFMQHLNTLQTLSAENDQAKIKSYVSPKFKIGRDFGGSATGDPLKDFNHAVLRTYQKKSYLNRMLKRPYVRISETSVCSVVSSTNQEGFPDNVLCFGKEQGIWKFVSFEYGGD